MHKTGLGVLALGCAAAGDVTAWCLLAFVVGVAQAQVGGAFVVLGLKAPGRSASQRGCQKAYDYHDQLLHRHHPHCGKDSPPAPRRIGVASHYVSAHRV